MNAGIRPIAQLPPAKPSSIPQQIASESPTPTSTMPRRRSLCADIGAFIDHHTKRLVKLGLLANPEHVGRNHGQEDREKEREWDEERHQIVSVVLDHIFHDFRRLGPSENCGNL